jgi:hypothetical protein
MSGVKKAALMNSKRATAKARKAKIVKGIRSRAVAGGRCPVITAEGMKAWAMSIAKAKVINNGKKVQSSTNQLWILSQSAVVKASGSITGIVSLPSPGLLSLPGETLDRFRA